MDQGAKTRMKIRSIVFTWYAIAPAMCVAAMWFSAPARSVIWWAAFAFSHALMSRLVYVGNWSWVGVPLRWIFPAALIAAAYHSAGWHGAVFSAAMFLVLIGLPLARLRVTAPRAEGIRLSLPFSEGLYYAAQAGQTDLLNRHYGLRSQKYAMDFLRLNGVRTRCRGFYPRQLNRYSIYGATLVSPCDGEVTHVMDEWPDQIPPKSDRQHPAGNHILIRHHDSPDTYVLLAHLQQHSALVKEGECVHAGQPVAKAGNSGNTSEPHLHIQIKKGGKPDAWSDGESVPMILGGRFLSRGDGVRVAPPSERESL